MEGQDRKDIAQDIKNRLSLRAPQAESLDILHRVMATGLVKKGGDLAAQLEAVKAICPSVADFDRDFLSLCFALATGVGKTRLMGAIVSYLHIAYGVKNFLVIAPNLTIYDKLIRDFTPGTPKYVLKGIEKFSLNPPRIITGDNYQSGKGVQDNDLFGGAVINVFNISKLTAKDKGHLAAGDETAKKAKIRRISETIGESYFEYLAGCEDLVVLMDESHRYRAEAGAKAVNELKPVLGIELTATPRTIKGQKETPFRNIAYEYALPAAMKDGFVKEPAVATRKGFVASNYAKDSVELERLKLNDGAHLHELTRAALVNYAQNHGRDVVKPFMLVVAEDKAHADQLEAYMRSGEFRGGYCADKIVKVYSGMSAEEDEKMVGQLLEIEKPGNKIEIVIHVNKLSEGWDVTNLYTIVPLRAANSVNLVEQSIGRGLRLPYGERTGDEAVDTLTVVSHDNYSKIIEAAKRKELVMFKEYVIAGNVPEKGKKVVDVVPAVHKVIEAAKGSEKKEEVYIPESAGIKKKDLTPELGEMMSAVQQIVGQRIENGQTCDLADEKTAEAVAEEAVKSVTAAGGDVPKKALAAKAVQAVGAMTIAIPKIIPVSKDAVLQGYEDFELDTADLPTNPVDDKIKVTGISSDKTTFVADEGNGEPVDYMNVLMGKMLSFDEIDYDGNSALIAKLMEAAIGHLVKVRGKEGAANILRNYAGVIAEIVRKQLKAHAVFEDAGFDYQVIPGCCKLQLSSALVGETDQLRDFKVPLKKGEKEKIKGMVFKGFGKCLYERQKFDSDPERALAVVIDRSTDVVRWFKPALSGFSIPYHGDGHYFPDFVVEAKDGKYLCEVKSDKDVHDADVVQKGEVAIQWCKIASGEAVKTGGKGWKYIFIRESEINDDLEFDVAVAKYVKTKMEKSE